MTTVVALRHGETAWNRERKMQGWAPVPLNELGREQASAAGAWLADEYAFDAVYSSDLLRTRQTAERVLAQLPDGSDRPVRYEAAWRERDIGVYQGLTYEDVYERFPEFGLGETAAEAAGRVPDSGESLADVYERATERFESVVDRHDDETVLVVSHGGPIYMLTGHAKSMAIRDAVLDHSQDNCGATVFDCSDGVEVVAENVTEWDA